MASNFNARQNRNGGGGGGGASRRGHRELDHPRGNEVGEEQIGVPSDLISTSLYISAIHLTSPLLLNKFITLPSLLTIKTESPLTIGSFEVFIEISQINFPVIKSITANFPDNEDE